MLTNLRTMLKSPGGRKLLKGLGIVAVFAAGYFSGPNGAALTGKAIDLLAVPALQMLGIL